MSANDFRLRDGIRFHPIPCGGSGEERYYRLELETASDNIVGLDALEDRLLTAGLNLRVSAVENILNTLFDVLPAYIAETGNAVRIGNLVTLKPCVTGTLAHANDAADPEKNHLEIRATVVPALRYALSRAPLVNVNRASDGIAHVAGGPDGRDCEVDEGHETIVTGHGIYLPRQAFDAANPPRDCRLVIETSGTSAAAESADSPLLSYRRKVKLVSRAHLRVDHRPTLPDSARPTRTFASVSRTCASKMPRPSA